MEEYNDYDVNQYDDEMKNSDSYYKDENLLGPSDMEKLSFHPVQFRRVRRGIIEECCKRPCTISTLADYCPIRSE